MNQRNNKKGQAMLFIVLALVLVFVFILIFSIMSQDQEDIVEEGKEGKETEVNVALNTIEGCVSRTINEKLLDLGKQGLKEDDVVHVVMKRPSKTLFNIWNHYPPFVCEIDDFPFIDNSLFLNSNCENKEAYIISPSTSFNRGSLEYGFESMLKDELDECYSFPNEAYGFDVEPASELSVDVTFGKNELIVDVERSVQIDFNDGSSTKISSDVRETIDLRIGDLIAFANSVIWYDSTNLSFDPVAYISDEYDGFSVQIEQDPDNEVDILKFIDDKSHVNGQKFELWAGRENVWPIISFVPEQIYINLSNQSQYLPDSVFLDNFIGNCSEGNTEEAQSNLINYLLTEIKFYDRDEDHIDISIGTDLDCSEFPGGGNSGFVVEFNVTDGALNDSLTISFAVVG